MSCTFRRALLFVLLAAACIAGCPRQDEPSAAALAPAAPSDEAAEPERKTLAVVLGASENDSWTAALLTTIGAQLDIDPLAQAGSAEGLDVFGPYECQLGAQPLDLHIALCDLSSVADLTTQQQLGKLAQKWVEQIAPDAVWLDGDQLQLQCGSALDAKLPIVFSGVQVRVEAFYEEGRAVCGVMRQHSLARAMSELFKLAPEAKEVALVSDDSPLGLSRIAEVRALEQAMPYGVTFVTQEPAASWRDLRHLLAGLDSGIDGVLVCAVSGEGGGIARSGQPVPPGLLDKVEQPVLVYGPSALDGSGALSLRIKPSAHAREALRLCGEVLAGKAAAPLGMQIPDEMELYRSEG